MPKLDFHITMKSFASCQVTGVGKIMSKKTLDGADGQMSLSMLHSMSPEQGKSKKGRKNSRKNSTLIPNNITFAQLYLVKLDKT